MFFLINNEKKEAISINKKTFQDLGYQVKKRSPGMDM